MADSFSTSSTPLHDPETANLKILLDNSIEIETTDHDILNKYAIHKFNQYAAANAEDYGLWDCIQVDIEKFEGKHFDQLYGSTWKFVRDYCYSHGYWIDHNFGTGKTRTTTMLKAVEAEWNDEWSLEQIKWVERRYDKLSRITRKRKQELTGITNPESTGNLESTTANSQRLPVEPYHSPPLQPPQQQTPYPPTQPQSSYRLSQPPNEPQKDTANQYSKELIMLDKVYKDEDKFSGTGDNFNFKVIIFYDKCRRVGLPPNAYIYGASIMLSGQAQTHYYANRGDTSTFDQFCNNMQLFFEGPEWQRLNLTKWQTLSLTDIIFANPTLSTTECLRKLCIELNTIQRGVDPAYHGTVHLRENIIRACRGHPALTAGLTNPPLEPSGLVNNLYTSIINYEAVHKPSSTDNYVQSETDWEDEMFFTDRQYRRNRPMRGRHRGTSSSSRPSYRPGTFQRTKKCFVCGKVGCWSSNHAQQECDDSKKKFGDRYPENKARPSYEQNLQRWIIEYEGVDDDEDIAHYFGDLSIDTNRINISTTE